jgi:Dolichyl-phosphate-mannose-protein mannosyltransferase
MGDAGTRHIEAEASPYAKREPSDLGECPAAGYSLTSVGVIGQQTVRDARPRWRGRSLEQLLPTATVAAGLVLGAVALLIYIAQGYSRGMLWLWLAGVGLAVIGFALRSRVLPRVAWVEPIYAFGAAAVCAPLYLVALYRWPVQVSSDEIAVMDTSQQYATLPGVDPFGVSFYLTRPALLFIAWGRLGNLLGGVDLFHMRLLHAVAGLATVAACYALFRVVQLPRRWAFLAALLVGVNHAMFMISRLAMRENTAVLVLVVALTLLFWGLRESNELASFVGGLVAGLGFYVYYPARVAFPIWIAFLIAVGLLFKHRFAARRLFALGAVTTAGFLLVATPIVYAETQIPAGQHSGQGDSLMIFQDARVEQQRWVFADSQFEGWWSNVKHGLGAFNSDTVDHSWIYPNYGHGFLDPLTGVVLWVGAGIVGLGLIRRRRDDEGAVLMLLGFLALWLSFAFLVNKAPNYTRLLIALPFVAYLVVEALRWATTRWRSIRYGPELIVGGFLVAVVALNLSAAWDYVQLGRKDGDPIGSTGRYLHAHENVPGQKYFVVSSNDSPYYVWGDVSASFDRLRLFTRRSLVHQPVPPSEVESFTAVPPFALLMRREVWDPVAGTLADRYPRGRLRNVTPDGTRVVLEVPS